MAKATKTWNPTKYQFLYRHRNGTYYARIYSGDKEVWRSLRTDLVSVARPKLAKLLEQSRKQHESGVRNVNGRMTVGDLIRIRLGEIDGNPRLKPRTRDYWREIYESLLRSWPGLDSKQARSISEGDCREWAGTFSKKISSTRFNNTLHGLRHLFKTAIREGVRYSDPTEDIKRVAVRLKQLNLPSTDMFLTWVAEIRNGHGRFSRCCADFVEFLAYSGLRVGEAKWLEWRHCDFERGEIVVTGDPETGTKNSEIRRVPMIPELRALLERLRSGRQGEPPTTRVLEVNEAQKAMDRAAVAVEMDRITHHDLRHFFATICIESGVDMPTVSRWLGHKDGGALAMKVYGHLRDEHSKAQAQKVSLTPV